MTHYHTDETLTQAISKNELVNDLKLMGIQEGMVLEVHSSMKKIGYVIGGAQSVVDALLDCIGYDGTLIMATQDSQNTEPSYWQNPPIERRLWSKVRENMPGFDPDASEIHEMGDVANNLNRRQGAYRSYHPNCGFVAYGKYARLITNNQSLNFPLGEQSPLAAMYQLPTYVLLIGVGYDNCTSMHLGEYRSDARRVLIQGGAIEENGYRKWVKYLDLDLNSDEFAQVGKKT